MTSLTSGGSWTNDQHTGEAVDPTGLTFEVHYANGTSASVSPQAHTPSVWGETAGTQTCTFTYTEDGESVSCAVEATVTEEPVVTLDSLTITGSLTNDQFVGHAPDLTGLTFTANYSDSTLDHSVDVADLAVVPAEYDTAGEQTLAIGYTDEYGTVTATQGVTVLAVELSALAVTGDFTDTQYTGAAPTKTGLTFTASYNDGTSETVSASDITVTPATWDASGNPDNLGEQTATFSYTENGVTKTATKAVVIHRPSSGQVLDMNQEGWIFFDLTPEMKTLCANGQWGPGALFQSQGAAIGDPAFFAFTESEYENDIPVTAATLASWLPLYGLGSQGEAFQQVGTPNESGFKPGYGVGARNISDLNDCYVAVRTDGTATMPAGDETAYVVIGTLANALDGTSYKLSDMSITGRTVYSAICRKSS